jgi:hypothetical protein
MSDIIISTALPSIRKKLTALIQDKRIIVEEPTNDLWTRFSVPYHGWKIKMIYSIDKNIYKYAIADGTPLVYGYRYDNHPAPLLEDFVSLVEKQIALEESICEILLECQDLAPIHNLLSNIVRNHHCILEQHHEFAGSSYRIELSTREHRITIHVIYKKGKFDGISFEYKSRSLCGQITAAQLIQLIA